jgi:hypothetical protein
MIRAFDWRDVRLVKTLADQGVWLDAQTSLIHGTHPLQNALLAYLMPGTGAPTLVWRDNGSAVFGQLRHRSGEEQARVLFVAPTCATAGNGWLAVIERLAVVAGERGAHSLIAEVNENTSEFAALRAAGFAIYARQSVWKLAGAIQVPNGALPLRAAGNADGIGVNTLYANVVPRLVQQVEPPPHPMRGYVLEMDGELIAYLDVRRGSLGIWVEPYLHPEADQLSEAMLLTGLNLISSKGDKPVYVCVRRYQDWLKDILERGGCEAVGSQAVMVKRLTVRLAEPVLKPLAAIEGQVPTTTPLTQTRVAKRR